MKTLSKWEDNFKTATESKWARHPGRSALEVIHRVYVEATGSNVRLNTTCATCVLNLLTDVGRLYFTSKNAQKPAKNEAKPKKRTSTPKTKKSA